MLPAWETDDTIPRVRRQKYERPVGRIADEGMNMVKAYWANVDWMYNVVPVNLKLRSLHDQSAHGNVFPALASHFRPGLLAQRLLHHTS